MVPKKLAALSLCMAMLIHGASQPSFGSPSQSINFQVSFRKKVHWDGVDHICMRRDALYWQERTWWSKSLFSLPQDTNVESRSKQTNCLQNIAFKLFCVLMSFSYYIIVSILYMNAITYLNYDLNILLLLLYETMSYLQYIFSKLFVT